MRRTLVAILFLSIAACSGDDGGSTGTVIGPAGGTVTSADGAVTLDFPPGAVPDDTVITIAPVEAADAADQGFGALYELGPDGTQFAQPVTITMRGEGDLTGVRVAKAIDGGPGKWADDTVVEGDTVRATIHSFSSWGWTYCGELWCMQADAHDTPRGVEVHFRRRWLGVGDGFSVERAAKVCLNGTTIEECLSAPGDASFTSYWNWSGCSQCPAGVSYCSCDQSGVMLLDTGVASDSHIYYYRFADDPGGGARAFLAGESTNPTPCQDFTVAASPAGYAMAFNGVGQTTITVTPLNGFAGSIELVHGTGPFESLRFDATTISPGAQTTVFHTDYPYQRGSFPLTVTAQRPGGGGSTCTTSVTVTVD